MQPRKELEDPFVKFGIDADAVILDPEPGTLIDTLCIDPDSRWGIGAIGEGVVDQVFKDQDELRAIGLDDRHVTYGDLCLGSVHLLLDARQSLGDHRPGIHPGGGSCTADNSRIDEKGIDQLLHTPGPVNGEADELETLLIQTPGMPPFEQLKVTRDHPEWFLKVMTGGVDKLL